MEAQKWLRCVTVFVTESETGRFCGVGLEALSSLDGEAARDGESNPIFSALTFTKSSEMLFIAWL